MILNLNPLLSGPGETRFYLSASPKLGGPLKLQLVLAGYEPASAFICPCTFATPSWDCPQFVLQLLLVGSDPYTIRALVM